MKTPSLSISGATMTESLTGLLEEGETLTCPIYATLIQENCTYYGYFGLTENCLLIALLSGKHITYTSRIPLDIKCVKIKKDFITRNYILDISFNYGAPCKIMIPTNIFGLHSQKVNLFDFISSLKAKSTQKWPEELNRIKGEKIRRQTINIFIYIMLSFFPMPIIFTVILTLKENTFSFYETGRLFLNSLPIYCLCIAPFLLLSLLQRFILGKIVCVFDDDGLHTDVDFVAWKNINKVVFKPCIYLKSKERTCVTVYVKCPGKDEYFFDIYDFPASGLAKIKRHRPEIKIEFCKAKIIEILIFALIPTAISILLSFLK